MHVGEIIAQIGEEGAAEEPSLIGGIISLISEGVEAAGVTLIVIGLIVTTTRFLIRWRRGAADAYEDYREGLGRALLLGIEFLVAGDIIRTVAVAPTFENVAVLGVIVIIRTFLSWTLNLEVEGTWPWQRSFLKASPPSEARHHEPPKPRRERV
jgi:uncharacterized membrane protein